MTGLQSQGGAAAAGGLNEAVLAGRDKEDLGGAGGSSGGGTMAGAGEPSGGTLDRAGDTLADVTDNEVAKEAAALGPSDGSLADAANGNGPRLPGVGPVGGETVGSGAGRGDPGSGTPGGRGELGGGGPLGQHGGTGPASSDGGR